MFNFKSGTDLAIQQDDCIAKLTVGVDIPKRTMDSLINNLWIMLAAFLAPDNLVIRQWCLIDIISGKPNHSVKIKDMINKLSYRNISTLDGEFTLWAEGYSYYEYTKVAIDLWIKKFDRMDFVYMHLIKEQLQRLDDGFIKSSYMRHGALLYPAPYGDLRDEPLRKDLQVEWAIKEFKLRSINFSLALHVGFGVSYSIFASPIGLNSHVPKDDFNVTVIDGYPRNFTFYSGWKNKYKNKWEEFKDSFLSLKRWISIEW